MGACHSADFIVKQLGKSRDYYAALFSLNSTLWQRSESCILKSLGYILHKDELTQIIDNTYGMRIKAIYSLFRSEDVDQLQASLVEKRKDSLRLLESLNSVDGLQTEVRAMKA